MGVIPDVNQWRNLFKTEFPEEVSAWLRHWKDRAEKAELQVRNLKAVVSVARDVADQWKRSCTYDTPEIRALYAALETVTEKQGNP